MKKITALITVVTILFAMALPTRAEDAYAAVSVGKPIEALYGEGDPSNANDSSTVSRYTGSKSYADNALTMDLEKQYILDHVSVTMAYAETSSVWISNDAGFTTYVELEEDRTETRTTYYKVPAANAEEGFRYVRYNFTTGTRDTMVYDIKAYTTEENSAGVGPKPITAPVFTEELLVVSQDKPILSMQYGEGAGWASDVVANAVDDDAETQFTSCQVREKPEWVTIDLEEPTIINKITAVFTAQRTYAVYVTNTAYGQEEEFTDGIQMVEASSGSKVFEFPDEYKNTAFRYVRLRFNGDAPNTGNDTEQNVVIKDIKVYKSSRDVVYNAADGKGGKLTDGDIQTSVLVASNTVIDLLAPTYIGSYELFGQDKEKVVIKGSLFNESVHNMTVIPEKTTENKKYRYIAIESADGSALTLNEIKLWSYFSDVATPWKIEEDICSVTITNTSYKDDRTYTFKVAVFDECGSVIDIRTITETLHCGETKKVTFENLEQDVAKRVVCIVERDRLIVSEPAIFVDGRKVNAATGTPYIEAPSKNIDAAISQTVYTDGLELTVSDTVANGILDSDILTFCVYSTTGELLSSDAGFAGRTFKYRLPGDAVGGKYKVELLVTDAYGNAISAPYEFTKTAPLETDVAAAINAFVNATTDDEVKAAYQEYYVVKGTIGFGDIPEAEILIDNGLGNSFIRMMSSRQLWKKNVQTTLTAEDIRDCMKAAVIENSLENSRSNAPTVLTKFASSLDNVFDGNQNNLYTTEIFKKGAQNSETLIYNMKVAAALSQMKKASSEDIAEVLQNYKDILSVDLDAIENSGLELLFVASRLDNEIPESYLDGLATEIAAILAENEIPDENDHIDTPDGDGFVVSVGVVGGGSTGGGRAPAEDKTEEEIKQGETSNDETIKFNDVANDFWAAQSISKLAQADIISGRGDGIFDPDSNVSRAEFITMLVRAFKLISKPEEKPEFADCKIGDWFYPYIDAAFTNDIVNGISKTEFAPNATIKRQDACVMSYNMMVYKNYLKYVEGKTFNDSEAVSQYAKEAVNMLSGSGVINGFDDGSFKPHEQLSRAQAAVIVHNLMVLLGEEV